jgi:flagellar basal-body rod protein FlgG
MMQSLWTSLSGLAAGQDWLTRVGGNVANVETPGFAQQRGSFADTLTAALSPAATAPTQAGRYTPLGWRGGSGVRSDGVDLDFSQMPVQQTGNEMDLAIDGPAFFLVRDVDGRELLTKAGNLAWSRQADGSFVLTTGAGMVLLDANRQPIRMPAAVGGASGIGSATGVTMQVAANGQVRFGTQAGPRIALVEVPLPSQSLQPAGNNAYALRAGWQMRIVNQGTTGGASSIRQGALNQSNVDLTSQMAELIQAQRMFELNSEALQMTDRMMQVANSIRS